MVAARAWNAVSAAVVGACVAEVCGVLSDVDGVPEAGEVVVLAELLLGGVLDGVSGGVDCDSVLELDELGVVVPLLGVVVVVVVAGGVVGGGVVGGGVVGGGVVGGGVVGGGVVDAGTWTSWHCQITGELVTVPPTPPTGVIVAAMPAGANAALAAKPAAAVKSVPPAMRPIATGRTRAKHM